MQLPRLVMFDLDGTLVDTVPDIAVALNAALMDLGYPSASEQDTRCWVGNGARVLCGRAISRGMEDRSDARDAEALLARFLERYAERACERSRVYEGARESLAWLGGKGVGLACITNKPAHHTALLLDALDLAKHFALVIGGDALPRKKPDPLPLVECLRHFGVLPAEALMVGDSANDVDAARAAGIASVCVTYGYHQGRDVRTLGAGLVIDSLAELPHHLSPAGRSPGSGAMKPGTAQ